MKTKSLFVYIIEVASCDETVGPRPPIISVNTVIIQTTRLSNQRVNVFNQFVRGEGGPERSELVPIILTTHYTEYTK